MSQEAKVAYLAQFADGCKGLTRAESSWVSNLRRRAIDDFAESGFPNPKEEDWRFTRVTPIVDTVFTPGQAEELSLVSLEELERFPFKEDHAVRLVFVNGHWAAHLSAIPSLPEGVYVGSLAQALQSQANLLEPHLGRLVSGSKRGFCALNTAFFADGAFVYLPKGMTLRLPIYFLFLSNALNSHRVSYPRNLLIAEEASQCTVLEMYLGLSQNGEVYFTNAITEIVVGPQASLRHCKFQLENPNAVHLATTQVHQERDSQFSSYSISLGGALARNELGSLLNAPGGNCSFDGLYYATDHRQVDTHTVIDHAEPQGTSREIYKGILADNARGVFNGKIFVRPKAQKTDSKQTNNNLLLSEGALIDTKPQLEIFADDVRCTHGATIGQLDKEALFYLRARGMSEGEARSLLVYAFASEIIERLPLESVRTYLENLFSPKKPRSILYGDSR